LGAQPLHRPEVWPFVSQVIMGPWQSSILHVAYSNALQPSNPPGRPPNTNVLEREHKPLLVGSESYSPPTFLCLLSDRATVEPTALILLI